MASRPPAIIAWTSVGVGAEGGRHLGGLENPEPPAGAGADEDDPAALAQRRGDHLDADGDALALAPDRGQHLAVFVDHQVDDLVGGELVDAEARRVDCLRRKRLPFGAYRHRPTILANAFVVGHAPVDAYLTHLTVERRLAANSVESYARDLVLLASFAAGRGTGVDSLARPDLEALVRDLMAEGRSPRSVARAVACFRGFYRFLVIDGRVTASPADDLHPPRAWKVLPRYLSVEEVDRLIAQPDVSTPRGLRDRALIELLYATGMRVSELLTLRPADVNLEASYLTCIGKGDKQRIVPIGDEAGSWVARYIREARPVLLGAPHQPAVVRQRPRRRAGPDADGILEDPQGATRCRRASRVR